MKNLAASIATGLLAMVAIFALNASPAVAQQASTKTSAVMTDKDFVKTAAQAGMAEVQASRLALKKSQDEAVRNFAQRMVDDHTKANDKLKAIARSAHLNVPDEPSKKQQKKIESLHKVSGDTFNERYVDFFGVPAHEEAVNLFEREAKSGSDPALRDFAQKTLPTLREHLQMARELHTKMSAAQNSSQTGGRPS